MFNKTNCLRRLCFNLCIYHNFLFDGIILSFIIVGSIKLGADTYIEEGTTLETYSVLIDTSLTYIFFVEFLIISITRGFIVDENSYLRESFS